MPKAKKPIEAGDFFLLPYSGLRRKRLIKAIQPSPVGGSQWIVSNEAGHSSTVLLSSCHRVSPSEADRICKRGAYGVALGAPAGPPPEESHPDQTIMETEAQRGNCLQATLAAILGRPLDTVPHFVASYPQGDDWWDQMCGWLYDEGYLLRYLPITATHGEVLPLCGLGGFSERGFPHIVVGDTATGQMVHDPHPSRAGLTKVDYTVLLYRRNAGVKEERNA